MTLPNFLIIGPERCGTTSLFIWLREHPEVCTSAFKEACYFVENREQRLYAAKTLEEYEAMFAKHTTEKAIGEACPAYLHDRTAADRIRTTIPDTKLIAILRNPAERAYSHWLLMVKRVGEHRSAEAALQPGYVGYEHSFYADALRRYLERFPRENLKILLFEDLTQRTDETLREVFLFLGIDPDVKVRSDVGHNAVESPRSILLNSLLNRARKFVLTRVGNPHRIPTFFRKLRAFIQRPLFRKREPMPPALRARLVAAYRQDVEQTAALLGRDLSHWLK